MKKLDQDGCEYSAQVLLLAFSKIAIKERQ